jgi:hypothetical protein
MEWRRNQASWVKFTLRLAHRVEFGLEARRLVRGRGSGAAEADGARGRGGSGRGRRGKDVQIN